jgi:hypothetical protein
MLYCDSFLGPFSPRDGRIGALAEAEAAAAPDEGPEKAGRFVLFFAAAAAAAAAAATSLSEPPAAHGARDAMVE